MSEFPFRSVAVWFTVLAVIGCAGEPKVTSRKVTTSSGPIPPYSVIADALDETSGPRLAETLRGIDGVDSVALDLEAGKVSVQTEEGSFLYAPQVRAAAKAAEVELASFRPPSEASVTVYVVETEEAG